MKKIILPVLALLAMASCDKESYSHRFQLFHPQSNVMYLFGDQTKDSICFITTDSYTFTSAADWLQLDPKLSSQTLKNIYSGFYSIGIPVTIEPNATGELRDAVVSYVSSGENNWNVSSQILFRQKGWSNVVYPTPDTLNQAVKPNFIARDSAMQVIDDLAFNVYGDWTLTDGKFVHPTVMQGHAGDQKLKVTMEPNDTGTERTDSIYLTCNGVVTILQYRQDKQKEN